MLRLNSKFIMTTAESARLQHAERTPGPLDFDAVMRAPFGCIGIRTQADRLARVEYLDGAAAPIAPRGPLARRACAQIAAYLSDSTYRFEVPYALEGTAFERAVWEAIAAIPCGETRTYGALAAQLGSSARAVGRACGDNPVPLIVPCHRVVAAGGRIGGFMHSRADAPLAIKRWLLQHESRRL